EPPACHNGFIHATRSMSPSLLDLHLTTLIWVRGETSLLEQIPQELVIDLVVILNFGGFHESAEMARAAVRRRLLQFRVTAFHIFAQQFRCPSGLAEIFERRVNIVRQVAFRLPEIFDLRRLALESRLED